MIKVNFKDVMATEGNYAVTDVEKYVILNSDGSEKGKLEDINGVRIVVTDDGKAVEIYVPSKVDADDKDAKSGKDYLDIVSNDKIRIARVADAADNKMELMIKDITLKVSDLIKVNSVKAVARDTVEIAFDDELVIFEASDIVIAKEKKVPSELKDNELYEIAGVDTKLKDGKTIAVFTLDDDDLLDFNVNNGGNGLYVYVIPTVEVKDGDDKTESENKYNKTLRIYNTAETAWKADDKIAPKLYNDGEDTDYAQSDGEIAHVKDYLAFKSTVIDGVYFFDATIYFSEEIEVYDSEALLAGNDFDITLDGDKLVNGKDYFVEDYGKVGDKEVGFVTIRFIGKDIKDDPDDKELKTGKKFEGDLSIGLVEKPQYVMDPRKNVIADFDAIELDNLEVIRKY
jgi:hypothetical protein